MLTEEGDDDDPTVEYSDWASEDWDMGIDIGAEYPGP